MFGARGDNRFDDSQALQDCIDAAALEANRTIRCTSATYRLTKPIVVHQGICIEGEGAQGSTIGYGTAFVHASDGNCFVWDGNGAPYAGTGGGLRNCLVQKEDRFQGGVAISILGTDDDHRPGEMLFDNVLIDTSGQGSWSSGILLDGTADSTPGSRGVRDIYLRKVRISGTSDTTRVGGRTVGRSIILRQVTHFGATDLILNQGNSDRFPGVFLEGINDSIFFANADVDGTFCVVRNDQRNRTINLTFSGKISSSICVSDTQVTGEITAVQPTKSIIVNASPELSVRSTASPFFSVCLVGGDASITGDGTAYTLSFDKISFDRGNNWSSPHQRAFKCDCAGKYRFNAVIALSGVGPAHTNGKVSLKQSGSTHLTKSIVFNPVGISSSGVATVSIEGEFILREGDVMTVSVSVSNGERVVGLLGSQDICSRFEGALVA